MGKTIVITNRKGGCGKSVTAANLGVGLARQGKKVLLIDADNQHSLTISMGVTEPDRLPITLTTVISDIIAKKDFEPTSGIIHHAEGVDLLPSNDSLTGKSIFTHDPKGRVTAAYLSYYKVSRFSACLRRNLIFLYYNAVFLPSFLTVLRRCLSRFCSKLFDEICVIYKPRSPCNFINR